MRVTKKGNLEMEFLQVNDYMYFTYNFVTGGKNVKDYKLCIFFNFFLATYEQTESSIVLSQDECYDNKYANTLIC